MPGAAIGKLAVDDDRGNRANTQALRSACDVGIVHVEHRDIGREELRDLLLGVLMGALVAADAVPDFG